MKAYQIIGLFVVGFFFQVAQSQYYYFDTGVSSYPYQQGCSEQLLVRVNTQTHPNGPTAGLLQLHFDNTKISYTTSSVAIDLQNNLFLGSSQTFANWTSPTGTPSWIDPQKTILQVDRNNGATNYLGSNGLYGTIRFVPLYLASSAVFGIVYNGDTIKTSLSYGGANIINSSSQNSRLTGNYAVLQQPCVADSTNPSISISNPFNGGSQQQSAFGINFSVSDDGGSSSDVPYVWTGGIWTGNQWNLDPQYGIDISSLQISIAGNGQSRNFSSGTYALANNKTWQGLDKNYTVSVPQSALFDYGIEKQITMSIFVNDRVGRSSSTSISFNQPVGPWLIGGSRSPAAGIDFVKFDEPVILGIQDDWAGVNPSTIQITIQGSNASGLNYGPYIFSGSDLNLSGVAGSADLPDQYVSLLTHPDFPSSSTITISVTARDMAGNLDTIGDYSFSTRPSCGELNCCQDKQIQYKDITKTLFRTELFVTGGNNPYFTSVGDTGYLYCGMENSGIAIYNGVESQSGSAQLISYLEDSNLQLLGNNVKAILSGSTLYLSKIFEYGSLATKPGGFGGGNPLTIDSCPSGDNSPSYYDHTCEGHAAAKDCSVDKSPYSPEINAAFQYAYSVGITTQCPITKANITGNVLRTHMAKMLVEYAVQIGGLYPDLSLDGCSMFDDLGNETSELQFYAKTACQLGLMGYESNGITVKKSFDPKGLITRAQFGTILSRMIFGEKYNSQNPADASLYYVPHLKALKENRIMNYIDGDWPQTIEQRGFVMIMLKRVSESGIIEENRLAVAAVDGMNALLGDDLINF